MPTPNYLLGRGEKLTKVQDPPGGRGGKRDPYNLKEQIDEVGRRSKLVTKELNALPDAACPGGEAVAAITLHPSYLSKSSFPNDLFKETGLRSVGSRQRVVTPRKIVTTDEEKEPSPTATAEIYVAGTRAQFAKFEKLIPTLKPDMPAADDLLKIEDFRVIAATERIQPQRSKDTTPLMEFVLHTGGEKNADAVRESFKKYMKVIGVEVDLTQRIDAGQLCFIAVRMPRTKVPEAAKFSFLRTTRDMPRLRQLHPMKRKRLLEIPFACSIPNSAAIDSTIRTAIFDGGIPDVPALKGCVILDESFPDLAAPVPEFLKHGLAVTSAYLFGPLPEGKMAAQPYSKVHHFRVLDVNSESHPQDELYPVLRRILSVLEDKTRKFQFVGLSIGPDIPMNDDEVHPWTAKLDAILGNGKTLACIAAGNSGEGDKILGYDRIQPPADCVNALAVGACTSEDDDWKRTIYSSGGHGRSPGFVKPDGLAFGGTEENPFWVLEAGDETSAYAECGTSFAGPYLLRTGAGVSAQMPSLTTLAIRALLVHRCERNPRKKSHNQKDVGWGRFCTDVERLITCAQSGTTVVYQGELTPKKVLRAEVPLPEELINGDVTISVTICIATPTDPQDPIHYTRSSILPTFRKDRFHIPPDSKTAESDPFFGPIKGMSEVKLRKDAKKWETTLHRSKTFDDGTELRAPVFDLHYVPREEGRDADNPPKIPYAMIVSVSSSAVPDMFDRVWKRYENVLQRLQPRYRVRTKGS